MSDPNGLFLNLYADLQERGVQMSWQEELEKNEKVVEVSIERLQSFSSHPFHVQSDQQMMQLKMSIMKYGILTPILVRPQEGGFYEIISGHRRIYVAKMLGYRKVPVIVRRMQDQEAVICMVDSNIQREFISYSEKAIAYRMKQAAVKEMKRKSQSGQLDHKWKGKRTIEILSEESGESAKQVQRYLKLADLIPELLDKLDNGEIAFSPAIELAYLTPAQQKCYADAMEYTQTHPSLSQAQRIKELCKEKDPTLEEMAAIMTDLQKQKSNKVVFKNEQLYEYFPRRYTPDMMKQEILIILKRYMADSVKEVESYV